MARKKPGRKKELTPERGITWPRWTGFRGMTVRDWLQLLIVPLALVVIGLLFEVQQAERENQRAEAERELAEQRAQDEALQAYLDQMGSLLLEKDLRTSEEDSEVRTLARARTLTVLERLDPSRKTAVMQFLVEAALVQSVEGGRGPIITLTDADLSGANLSRADLREANLYYAYLREANLRYADLREANLDGTDLGDADLSSAELLYADLRDADLSSAELFGAELFGANLSRADLRLANLSGARGVTEKRLEEQAQTLEGATMPNGQKYEDWLKDKEGRGEEGENSGPS